MLSVFNDNSADMMPDDDVFTSDTCLVLCVLPWRPCTQITMLLLSLIFIWSLQKMYKQGGGRGKNKVSKNEGALNLTQAV
jgi:hypothetical protein